MPRQGFRSIDRHLSKWQPHRRNQARVLIFQNTWQQNLKLYIVKIIALFTVNYSIGRTIKMAKKGTMAYNKEFCYISTLILLFLLTMLNQIFIERQWGIEGFCLLVLFCDGFGYKVKYIVHIQIQIFAGRTSRRDNGRP